MTDTERAVFKIHIKGRIEQVWKEITKTEGPNESFFNMKMTVEAFEPGAKYRMETLDGKYTGVVGEILEFDPPRRFAHTFKFTQFDDPPCKVTYELAEAGDGVDFTLIVDDMPTGTKTAKHMSSGGGMIARTLKAMVERGRPSLGTRLLYLVFKLFTPFTPKRCLSENWR